MSILDVFASDAFSMSELTASINRAPYQPGRIGALGLFEEQGIRTTTFELERKGRSISLLPSKPRGAEGTQHQKDKRNVRQFGVPHIPYNDIILADSIQGIREFNSENQLMAIGREVTESLDGMRQDFEVTHEFYRIGAIKGNVVDGDGSTVLVDLFSEFGLTQHAVDFLLGTAGTDVKEKIEDVRRHIEAALGALTYRGLHAFCGDDFWDKLVSHPVVKAAYDRWNDGAFLRSTQRHVPQGTNGFEFAGCFFENYRGKVGDVDFVPAADCRFIPVGVRKLFLTRYAPGDMLNAVNTRGLPMYAMQERMKFDKGVELHTQSNPLMICTIPEVLVRGHTSN